MEHIQKRGRYIKYNISCDIFHWTHINCNDSCECMTGASLWEAGAVAIVEPAINSVWFYVLHKLWAVHIKKTA